MLRYVDYILHVAGRIHSESHNTGVWTVVEPERQGLAGFEHEERRMADLTGTATASSHAGDESPGALVNHEKMMSTVRLTDDQPVFRCDELSNQRPRRRVTH